MWVVSVAHCSFVSFLICFVSCFVAVVVLWVALVLAC